MTHIVVGPLIGLTLAAATSLLVVERHTDFAPIQSVSLSAPSEQQARHEKPASVEQATAVMRPEMCIPMGARPEAMA